MTRQSSLKARYSYGQLSAEAINRDSQQLSAATVSYGL